MGQIILWTNHNAASDKPEMGAQVGHVEPERKVVMELKPPDVLFVADPAPQCSGEEGGSGPRAVPPQPAMDQLPTDLLNLLLPGFERGEGSVEERSVLVLPPPPPPSTVYGEPLRPNQLWVVSSWLNRALKSHHLPPHTSWQDVSLAIYEVHRPIAAASLAAAASERGRKAEREGGPWKPLRARASYTVRLQGIREILTKYMAKVPHRKGCFCWGERSPAWQPGLLCRSLL